MKDLFVPYHLATLLKEKGFNENCFAIYDNGKLLMRYKSINSKLHRPEKLDKRINIPLVTAPLHQQVCDWLRINYKIIIFVLDVTDKPNYYWFGVSKENDVNGTDVDSSENPSMDYYYEYNKAIEEAIKIIK